MATENTTITLEQLIATFGVDTANQMWAQMNASSGGSSAPFPFLKKVSTHGSEVGAFGEYAFGIKTEKDPKGNKTVTDKGTNVGKAFEFLLVNVNYRYTLWDEAKQKSYRSNMFDSLDGIKTAVDAYTGKALPATKEAKKDAGWKLNRINTGLIRPNAKAAWEIVTWETSGKLYFTLGDLIGKQPNGGLLSGVCNIVTALESKGATQFSVIDVEKSSFTALPKDLFTNPTTSSMLSEITNKMADYRKASQYSAGAEASQNTSRATTPPVDNEDVEW